jgi:polyisoprenoid-binding protein YceI
LVEQETLPTQAVESVPASEAAPTDAVQPAETSEPSSAAEAKATEMPTAEVADSNSGSDANASAVIFEIVQAESEARFIINEVLNGAPKTVVGVTDQVAGEIAIYPNNPAQTKIGTILVNARTLSTDNEFRNRAIKNQILRTDDYEFVTFTPTKVTELPERVAVGESFSFQIIGELTVRDVTNPVTFDATVTPTSETQLAGSASATILYADFGLKIPEARSVASVEDKVKLEIEFVAVAK